MCVSGGARQQRRGQGGGGGGGGGPGGGACGGAGADGSCSAPAAPPPAAGADFSSEHAAFYTFLLSRLPPRVPFNLLHGSMVSRAKWPRRSGGAVYDGDREATASVGRRL